MQITLITGISGSGKTVALNVLEDTGYYCVDNLPPQLLLDLVNTVSAEAVGWLGVAIDARSANSLQDLPQNIAMLRSAGHNVQVIYLTAATEALVARFSETRRSHPLRHRYSDADGSNFSLIECLAIERELLAPLFELGLVIDTSVVRANALREWVRQMIARPNTQLTLLFESFGFKYGVPLDADLVFDVRTLPNPFYDPMLRAQTGLDEQVISFLETQPKVLEMLEDICSLIAKWLPDFKRDNRSYLTVAIGCTGGWHRSVFMSERLVRAFSGEEVVIVRHRELSRAQS